MKRLAWLVASMLSFAAFAQEGLPEGTEESAEKKPEAPVADGPDVSKMPFTPDSIKQVVAHYQPRIQDCYEQAMASRKNIVEGQLATSWSITAEGLVKKPRVLKKGTTVRDAKLHQCVVEVLSVMQFPKPIDKREHPINYPFNLKAIK